MKAYPYGGFSQFITEKPAILQVQQPSKVG
jgi:hypothetical protein